MASACEPGAEIGLMHERFGLFWLDLWTWNGRYCLYKDDTYWELKSEDAAQLLGVDVADLPTPFWYRFPPLSCLLIAGGAAWAAVALFVKSRRATAAPGSMTDGEFDRTLELYDKAFEMIRQRSPQAPATAGASAGGWSVSGSDPVFRQAVAWLVQQGIPEAEAERNLAEMVLAVGTQPASEPEPVATA